MKPWALVLMLSLHVLHPSDAASQSRDAASTWQLSVDNDLFAVRGPGVPDDYDYSSGIRASVLRSAAPGWARQLMRARGTCHLASERAHGCTMSGLAVDHRIYTPRPNTPDPTPGERPYAGLLQGTIELIRVAPGHSRMLAFDAGVTGRLSLAEQLQNQLHRLLDNTPRRGWANQLPNAGVVSLRYAEGVRRQRNRNGRFTALDLRWGALAGNLTTAATAGVELSGGLLGTLPWSPADARAENPARAFITLGYSQDAVLHNVLVEGRRGGPGAVRRPMVGQLEGGLGVRHRRFAAVYKHIIRGREYDAQLKGQSYGTVALSVNRF